MPYRSSRWVMALACTTTLVATAACGSSGDGAGTTADGKIELTVATFNEFGYEELLPAYEAAHPNIKVVARKTGKADDHHQNLFTKIAAGSGLSDIEAVEEGYLPQVLSKADKFNNLSEIGPADVKPDRWLAWKSASATKNGSFIGYGTDIGPLAMCYRTDLFAAAGLPTDPAGVKAIFATWDSYFAAGDTFKAKTGDKAWFDSAAQVFNAMINQEKVGYYDASDKLVVDTNPDLKADWTQVTDAVAKGQSAKLVAFSNEWNTGFKNAAFATKTCPSWMLGVVEKQAGPENAGKWAVTDAFPEGGGNWGGSFLTVPKQSKHPKEAAELAAWLTAPEQQIKAFTAKGTFPSQVEALTSPALLDQTSAYFGNTKVGALFAEQAKKVPAAQPKGPASGTIQDKVFNSALQAVEQGTSVDDAWKQAVEGAQKAAK